MEIMTLRTDATKVRRIARMMKVISHESRLKIIDLLLERKKMHVKEIYEEIGISQSNASQHLRALEDIEVLYSSREGKNIYYTIQNPGVEKLLQCMHECTTC